MLSSTQHRQVEVSCPACAESYSVSIDTILESQRLLEELGPCSGMASYECPASYFASLAPPEAIPRVEKTGVATPLLAPELARWENEGGAPEASRGEARTR